MSAKTCPIASRFANRFGHASQWPGLGCALAMVHGLPPSSTLAVVATGAACNFFSVAAGLILSLRDSLPMAAVDRDEFSGFAACCTRRSLPMCWMAWGCDQVLDVELRRYSGQHVLAGPRVPMQWEDVEGIDPRPYELELQAVDTCGAGEVLVAAAGSSSRPESGESCYPPRRSTEVVRACWSMARCATWPRSTTWDSPFLRGTSARDSLHRQRVMALDVEIVIGRVPVAPGDMIFADADGAVVVPRAIEREALAKRETK